jgi:hypothetical protein
VTRSRTRRCVSLTVVASASIVFSAFMARPSQLLAHDGWSAPPWPCQLVVTGELRVSAALAWEHSPTFRDQCWKLAAAGAALIVEPASSGETWRAQTRIRRMDDGATIARARVRPGAHSVELIAHELEHVLEYLEGVKFLMEAHRSSSRVSLVGGAYETGRAVAAGHRVAREVRDATIGRSLDSKPAVPSGAMRPGESERVPDVANSRRPDWQCQKSNDA